MATPTQHLTLDVVRNGEVRDRVYLSEGDVNGTTLLVNVTEDRKPFDCTGYTPYLMVNVGESLYRKAGTASGTTVSILIDESKFAGHSGTIDGAYISLEDEDTTTSTQRFSIVVAKAALKSSGTAAILEAIDSLSQKVDGIDAKVDAIDARVAALESAEEPSQG